MIKKVLHSIARLGHSNDFNYFIRQINYAFNLTLSILMLGLVGSLIINIIDKTWTIYDSVLYISAITLYIICFYINSNSKFKLSALVYVYGNAILLFVLTILSGDIYLSRIINLVLLIIPFIYTSTIKKPIYTAVFLFSLHSLSFYFINSNITNIENSFYDSYQKMIIYSIGFICLTGIAIITKRFVKVSLKENQRLIKKLNNRNKEILAKNEELENFAYLISHDLKTPLKVMNGFSNLIQKEVDRNETKNLKKYSYYLNGQSEKLSSMIDDVLAYSKLDQNNTKHLEPVALEKIIESIKIQQNSSNKASATITYNSLGSIQSKESLLKILFQNLIENGLKYNRNAHPAVHVNWQESPTQTIIEVRDNGIGIIDANKETIFLLFKRLHNDQEFTGTGIGLATCKKIVEKHLKGKISVHKNPTGGSIFRITI